VQDPVKSLEQGCHAFKPGGVFDNTPMYDLGGMLFEKKGTWTLNDGTLTMKTHIRQFFGGSSEPGHEADTETTLTDVVVYQTDNGRGGATLPTTWITATALGWAGPYVGNMDIPVGFICTGATDTNHDDRPETTDDLSGFFTPSAQADWVLLMDAGGGPDKVAAVAAALQKLQPPVLVLDGGKAKAVREGRTDLLMAPADAIHPDAEERLIAAIESVAGPVEYKEWKEAPAEVVIAVGR
jgi:hypothetical protein